MNSTNESADDIAVDLYYIAFPNDRKVTKAIVGFVYSVGTIQTLVALHDFYKSFCVIDSSAVLFDDAVFNSFMWLTIPLSSTLGMHIYHRHTSPYLLLT